MRSPNTYIQGYNYVKDPKALGNNNIRRFFKWPFETLLTTEYYAGSEYGKIFNERRDDGRSKIYVDQPELENKLQTFFMNVDNDITKFLVGYTGIGKTTLIRNFFQVFDRDVVEKDGNLIIYVSLYAMVSSQSGTPEEKVKNSVGAAVSEAITALSGKDFIERLESYDSAFFEDFYNFIKINNKHYLHSYVATPQLTFALKGLSPHEVIL
jgi:molybdopterin converting factor small subunit